MKEKQFHMGLFKKILKDNQGSGYIDVVVIVIVISLSAMLVMKLMPVFVFKQQLDEFATDVSKIISIEGSYNDIAKKKISEYQKESNLNEIKVTLDETEYMPSTAKIQLGDAIVVSVSGTYDISFWQFSAVPIKLTGRGEERSEVYWKE